MPSYATRRNFPEKVLSTDKYIIEESLRLYKARNLSLNSRLSHSQLIHLVKTGSLPRHARRQRLFTLREIISSQISGYETNEGERFPDEILEEYGWKRSELEETALRIVPQPIRQPPQETQRQEEKALKSESINLFRQYLTEISQYPLLTREQEIELSRRIRLGDEDARKEFITSNLRLVVSIAHQYKENDADLMDLIQEGNNGLITAVKKFNPERGCRFSTYASCWIKQALGKWIKRNSCVRVPEWTLVAINKIRALEDAHLATCTNLPDIEEICKQTRLSPHQVKIALKAKLHASYCFSWFRDNNADISDIPDTKACSYDPTILERAKEILAGLDPRKKLIIKLHIEGETLEEIGKKLGLCRERVRQLEAKGYKIIRESLGLFPETKFYK